MASNSKKSNGDITMTITFSAEKVESMVKEYLRAKVGGCLQNVHEWVFDSDEIVASDEFNEATNAFASEFQAKVDDFLAE